MFRITAALESAYRATTYVVRVPPQTLALRIGERCPAIERLLATRKVRSAAYMTAWNPMSRAAGRAYNAAAARELVSVLRRRGWSFVAGEGRGEEADWPAEQSLLILGISRAQAYRRAADFGRTRSCSCAGVGRQNSSGHADA